ncbi:uncharacterized protein [Asterias amurensis]|uniref:uncharacterized protein n=1 Tax=Asterias amurensis TaxID=7602 RepID=UPI003AB815FB
MASVESLTISELDDFLCQFYTSLRKSDGQAYTRKSMLAIRFGLQRHFQSLHSWKLCKNALFAGSNKVFQGMLVNLNWKGKNNKVIHKGPISVADMNKIQTSNELDLSSPTGLQNKVFIDITVYFGIVGCEKMRDMKSNDFTFSRTGDNIRYVIVTNCSQNTCQSRDVNSESSCEGVMYEIPGYDRCPVASLEKYLSKLNPKRSDIFWQKPIPHVPDVGPWYISRPTPLHTLGSKMKTISANAGCRKLYTNNCLKATPVGILRIASSLRQAADREISNKDGLEILCRSGENTQDSASEEILSDVSLSLLKDENSNKSASASQQLQEDHPHSQTEQPKQPKPSDLATAETSEDLPSFSFLSSINLKDLMKVQDSKSTNRQLRYALTRLEVFAKHLGSSIPLVEAMSMRELDEFLCRFYANLRKFDGQMYTKKSMQGIRYGLQRYFQTLHNWDICKKSAEFKGSNKVFKDILISIRKGGKVVIKHKTPISAADMDKIQSSPELDMKSPRGLQNKVFFDIMVYLGKSNRYRMQEMKPSDFTVARDNNYNQYVSKCGHSFSEDDHEFTKGAMFEISNSDKCPVRSFQKYLSKLNPNRPDLFWQRPRETAPKTGPWYIDAPVGLHSLSDKVKIISTNAECRKVYTNDCLRITPVAVLRSKGMMKDYHSRSSDTESYSNSDNSLSEDWTHNDDNPQTSWQCESTPPISAVSTDMQASRTDSQHQSKNRDNNQDTLQAEHSGQTLQEKNPTLFPVKRKRAPGGGRKRLPQAEKKKAIKAAQKKYRMSHSREPDNRLKLSPSISALWLPLSYKLGLDKNQLAIKLLELYHASQGSTDVNFFGEKSTPLRSCIGFHGWKDVRYSDSLVMEITGVSLKTFHILLEQLPDPLPILGGLTTENGLLMFLMKLRMDPPYKYLAAQFSVAQATIEQTFLCILVYLVELSSACIQWPLKETVLSKMPPCIKRSYPKCRLVLDCLQIEVEAPEQLRDQLPMLSRLDSTFKAKALIGLTPNGCICFISKFFSGEILQSKLSKLSSVYYALHVGDQVLSLQPDSFISSMQGVSIFQAPILPRIITQTNPIYKEESVLLNKHVDMLKQRLRSFGILRSKLPCDMLPHIEMLVHICAVLANFETAAQGDK